MSQSHLFIKKLLVLSLFCTLLSCAKASVDPFDLNSGLTRDEIESSFVKNRKADQLKKAQKAQDEAPIPNVSKLIIAPPPPSIGGDKTISFSVTDQVPLKDVLIELGRVAKIDIDLDPTISGGIIVNAKNRPLKEVIDRIATLGKLRYSYENGVLHFERDAPYTKNYFVDYLTGSPVWTDVESNITSILNTSSSSNSSSSSDFSSSSPSSSSSGSTASSFSTNKSAGIISVFASKAQHDNISKYLGEVYRLASAQVLIEAKVVEVTLNKEFTTGIDWSWIGKDATNSITTGAFGLGETLGSVTFSSTSTPPTLPPTLTLGNIFGIKNGNINATIKALEKFGSAKAISSPRISAINNQQATLDFSENLIYFTLSTSAATTPNAGGAAATTTATVTATKNEIPIGVQLVITPSINLTTNEVTLEIKPKLSVDSGQRAVDPTLDPNTGKSLGNLIPIIRTRTLTTIAKIQSGNVLVIGGLMSDTTSNSDTGIPFLSKIPILGYLFKTSAKVTNMVETVVFIKATIVNSGSIPDKIDRDVQQKFDTNRRQFFQ